jgi:hypothetical protein
MNRIYYILSLLCLVTPLFIQAQTIRFSDYDREDNRDMNFEIIGKMNNNILVYKNIRTKHKINIYDSEMNSLETVYLDFVPDKTVNVDFAAYNDYFIMVYQYQKGSVLHCMAAKMDARAKLINEPVELDTTKIPLMGFNRIYTTITSEDRQKIMVFKVQTQHQKYNMQTLLFDKEMQLINKSRFLADYNERRDSYNNFSLANDGNFVFTYARQSGNRDNNNYLNLVTKPPLQNNFTYQDIELDKKYIDEVKLKIDNLNSRYVLNSFYYKKNRGNIEGLFTCIWDKTAEKTLMSQFTELYDSLRSEAKSSGMLRYALDNFFIRQVVVKGDGGFIITAEDYENQTNEVFNRYNYLYRPYSFLNRGYYYDPYRNYYRPLNSFGNQTSTRYYYENILVLSFSKTGKQEWARVIHKSQFDDNEDNFLSFSTMTSGSEIHFLFNGDKKYQIVSNMRLAPDGTLKRYPTLKNQQKIYEFMPALSKQVGSRQIIIPCSYRNNICFAKVDF